MLFRSRLAWYDVSEEYLSFDPFGDQSFIWKYRAFDDFTGDVARLVNDAYVSNMVAKA